MQSLLQSTFTPTFRYRNPTITSPKPPRKLSVFATSAAPKREKDPKKRVVITGLGVVSVFGNDVDTYYDKLLAGESGVDFIDRFDASEFPTRFAAQIRGFSSEGYIDSKNDRRLDNCLRYNIVAGKKALENAGLGEHMRSKVIFLLQITSTYFFFNFFSKINYFLSISILIYVDLRMSECVKQLENFKRQKTI